jgi:hypothetical protein
MSIVKRLVEEDGVYLELDEQPADRRSEDALDRIVEQFDWRSRT